MKNYLDCTWAILQIVFIDSNINMARSMEKYFTTITEDWPVL